MTEHIKKSEIYAGMTIERYMTKTRRGTRPLRIGINVYLLPAFLRWFKDQHVNRQLVINQAVEEYILNHFPPEPEKPRIPAPVKELSKKEYQGPPVPSGEPAVIDTL